MSIRAEFNGAAFTSVAKSPLFTKIDIYTGAWGIRILMSRRSTRRRTVKTIKVLNQFIDPLGF